MIRVLHLADLHPQRAGTYAGKLVIDPDAGHSVALSDCQKSLQACLDWEKENPCDLGIIAGDLFERPNPSADENNVISAFLYTLSERMPVVAIPGNHDILTGASEKSSTSLHHVRNAAERINQMPSHPLYIMVEDISGALIETARGPVRVVAVPYPAKGVFMSSIKDIEKMSPEDVMASMNANFAMMLQGEETSRLHPTVPNIFIGHGTVSTASVGVQPRSIAHDLMIPVDVLDQYDYVALGHIHQHQQVAANAWYSGSLLCQSFGEKDEVKGWCVVEVEKGQIPKVTHIPNPHSRRFIDLNIQDVMGELTGEAFADFVSSPDVQAAIHPLLTDLHDPKDVYRIGGEVSEGFYSQACLAIAKFEASHPFTQNAVQVVAPEERMRDSGMTDLLSDEAALERVVRTLVPEEMVSAVMEKHRVVTS